MEKSQNKKTVLKITHPGKEVELIAGYTYYNWLWHLAWNYRVCNFYFNCPLQLLLALTWLESLARYHYEFARVVQIVQIGQSTPGTRKA